MSRGSVACPQAIVNGESGQRGAGWSGTPVPSRAVALKREAVVTPTVGWRAGWNATPFGQEAFKTAAPATLLYYA
ncbi:MAG: hypothetical protein OHK0015_03660 [Chloroflexi bacterium OHK40]